jgi:hypothetical protein
LGVAQLDRDKIAKMLGRLGSSFDPEALTALRLVYEMLLAAGMTWLDLLAPHDARSRDEELRVAVQAAEQLFAENTALRAHIEQLERSPAVRLGQAGDWSAIGDHRAQAQWCLGLHSQGQVPLKSFEQDFLGTIAHWTRPLTERQQPIFEAILAKVTRYVGSPPP